MNLPVRTHVPARRALAFGLGTALLATAAGVCATTPALAATGQGWDPTLHSLPWVPPTTVDGEITVVLASGTDPAAGRVVSFRRDGSRVDYATSYSAKDVAWAPGGDALARVGAGGFDVSGGSQPHEFVPVVNRSVPGLWSPFGESTTATALGSGPITVRAAWSGANRSDALTPALATDPGVAAPTPDGLSVVLTVADPVSGLRDLATVEVDLPRSGNPYGGTPLNAPVPLGFGDLDAHDPVVSNDGTLAFVGTGDDGPAVFVVEGADGPVQVALLGEACEGQRPTFSPSGRSLAFVAAAPDCGTSALTVLDKVGNTFVGATGQVVVSSSDEVVGATGRSFATPSWRAVTANAAADRLGGSNRISTGISASRYGWPDGSEGAILASSESFPDALVAGPLAGAYGAPLLINPRAKLDPRVLAELKRLTEDAVDPFVYIVGGEGVISKDVRNALAAQGFRVFRISGADRFATSVAVAQTLDKATSSFPAGSRTSAFLADGTNFPDALSAGPPASLFYAPVLLSKGTVVPASVKTYVNGRSAITKVHAIGGQAVQAVDTFGSRAGERIAGADRFATSASVAQRWFPGSSGIGYANGTSFPDAVTGGAVMAALQQPLLLVSPTSVPYSVNYVARSLRPSTDDVVVFGGTGVVSDVVLRNVAATAGTQTALWGRDVEALDNPLWDQAQGVATRKTPSRLKTADARAEVTRSTTDALPRLKFTQR